MSTQLSRGTRSALPSCPCTAKDIGQVPLCPFSPRDPQATPGAAALPTAVVNLSRTGLLTHPEQQSTAWWALRPPCNSHAIAEKKGMRRWKKRKLLPSIPIYTQKLRGTKGKPDELNGWKPDTTYMCHTIPPPSDPASHSSCPMSTAGHPQLCLTISPLVSGDQ